MKNKLQKKSTGNTASGRSLTLALKWNMKRKVAKQRFCRNWEYPLRLDSVNECVFKYLDRFVKVREM